MANFFLRPAPIARTDLEVPFATVGAMMFGKRAHEAEARRIIDYALERGLNFFDTANVYQKGKSERLLGKALRGRRERCVVSTKVGNKRMPDGSRQGLARATILSAIDESLDNLATDYVDIYYFHAPDHNTPIAESVEAMAELIRAGKVRYFGLSNHGAWQSLEIRRLCEANGWPAPPISQMLYNPLVRQIEYEYVRFCRRHGVYLTVFNPLAAGLLTGKYADMDDIDKGGRFVNNPNYQRRFWSERMFSGMRGLKSIADEEGMSLTHLTLCWIASTGNVDNILLGPSTLDQLEDCLAAGDKSISPEGAKKIDEFLTAFEGTDISYAR